MNYTFNFLFWYCLPKVISSGVQINNHHVDFHVFLMLFSASLCWQHVVGYETFSTVNESEIKIMMISHLETSARCKASLEERQKNSFVSIKSIYLQ